MASGAAGDGHFFGFLEGSMAKSDRGFQRRRPYHKNCGCALHDKSRRGTQCSHSPCNNAVHYPIRRAWSEGSLALMADAVTSPGSSPAPATGIPVVTADAAAKAHLLTCKEE